jgi:hypothetical protein
VPVHACRSCAALGFGTAGSCSNMRDTSAVFPMPIGMNRSHGKPGLD